MLNVEDKTFETEVLQSTVPVLVDFWAPWCAPCRMIAPALEQLATEYGGKIKIAKMNIDEHKMVPQKYNVMSIPTLLMFKDGKPVDQVVGAVPKNQLENMIRKAL